MKQSTIIENKQMYNSYFDEEWKDYVLLQIKFLLICIFTLGFGYPWALCLKYKGQYHHSIVCGQRLKFIGKPRELLACWVWWWLVSVLTLGIFAIFAGMKMEQWVTANTVFDHTEMNASNRLDRGIQ